MKILVIAPFYPWPLTSGGKIRVFNLLKYLSRRHQITLACLDEAVVTDFTPFAEICTEVFVVQRKSAMFRDLTAFLFGILPFNARKYLSPEFRNLLKSLISGEAYDLVQCEFSLLWGYADLLPMDRVVLDAHNIETHIISQLGRDCRSLLKRILYLLEERKMQRLEERAWRSCLVTLAVSDKERAYIADSTGRPEKTLTVPNGVDLERYSFSGQRPADGSILLFAGFDYAPNLDSVRFFLKEILPLLKERRTDVVVDLVGREFRLFDGLQNQEGLQLHENVAEVRPFFMQSSILAVPLRQGAGTRIKILEAMAAGLPVVTTSIGCEGLDVLHGKHLLVADTSHDFASACLKLMVEPSLAHTLAANARLLVEERYSWERIVSELAQNLKCLEYGKFE
jgi:glycosyltransferase involved in cell wall biosynthesis